MTLWNQGVRTHHSISSMCFQLVRVSRFTLRPFRPGPTVFLILGWLTAAGTCQQVAVQLSLNFTGANSSALPSDAALAAGPNHVMEFVNGAVAVYDKSSGANLQSITDLAFWGRAGVAIPANWDVTDPRLVFDTASQRWFASQVDFDPSGVINTNHFLLAVSTTVDPTGTWKGFSLPSVPGGVNDFADFPTLGMDAQGVYLSGDLFDVNGNSVGPTLVSLPKAGLLAGVPTISGFTSFGVLSYSARGTILQPAVCMDGTGTGNVLATGGLGFNSITGKFETDTTLVASTVLNAGLNGGATLDDAVFLGVPGFTAPLDPTQPSGSQNLDDGDARFSATVHTVGGVVFATHGTEVGGRAAIRWYRIQAGTYTLLESGTISDPNLDLFYPSIAANSNGTIVIGYNGCSLSSYISSYAVVGQTVSGVTTFGSPLLLQSGLASYQNVDSSGTSRWGDYSATCVDPSDPTRFWTLQTFPSSRHVWSAQITQILTSPLQLNLAQAGTNVVISWTSLATGFQLQVASAASAAGGWSLVTQTPIQNGSTFSVTIPAGESQQFFRLAGP